MQFLFPFLPTPHNSSKVGPNLLTASVVVKKKAKKASMEKNIVKKNWLFSLFPVVVVYCKNDFSRKKYLQFLLISSEGAI